MGAAGLLLVALALGPAWPAGGEEVFAVIVSPDVEAQNVSQDQLRRIFMFRERYWGVGRPLRVLLPETQLEPRSFLLDRIYRMDYAALRRLIMENLYQGNIDLAPRVVATESVAVDYVAAGHGLITLVRFSAVEGKPVRVLAVDGVPPTAGSYALRR